MRPSRPRIMVRWAILVLALSAFVRTPAAGQSVTVATPPLAMGPMKIGEGLAPVHKGLLVQRLAVQEELALTPEEVANRGRPKGRDAHRAGDVSGLPGPLPRSGLGPPRTPWRSSTSGFRKPSMTSVGRPRWPC